MTEDRIHEKEKEVRAEFATLHEGQEQQSGTQNSVDVDTNTEEEMALWIKKWQRHFDIMQRQESDLRERLTECGFNPTSELTRGAEVSDSDELIDDEEEEQGSGVMGDEDAKSNHNTETTSSGAAEPVYWKDNDTNQGRKSKSSSSSNQSKPKKSNLANALLQDENMFPEHEQMMDEKNAAFYKTVDAQWRSNTNSLVIPGGMHDGADQKKHTNSNGSSSSSSSKNGSKKGADRVIPHPPTPPTPLLTNHLIPYLFSTQHWTSCCSSSLSSSSSSLS